MILIMLWLIIALIVIFVIMLASYYNRFVVLVNRIENSAAQIDVQLKKRADLVPNLIEIVKGYAKHEKNIMKEVTEARKALLKATNLNEKVKAGNKLEAALKSIFAIAENYPQLKASENFKELQEELTSIEEKIAYARQFYNDSILAYDNLRSTFPGNIFAKIFKKKELPYLKIEDEERKVVRVKF